LPFIATLKNPDRDNAIDRYISDEWEDVLADGIWQTLFTQLPAVFTRDEKKAWLARLSDVALGSDAFFPFPDNIDRAARSGVKYIAEPGGSIRDDLVIGACDKYGIAMSFTGLRLFHH
ncbi:MAG: phosphoribosylaminoimidazolecarboxamide formyltransferase, partial [Clostridia bacterium]